MVRMDDLDYRSTSLVLVCLPNRFGTHTAANLRVYSLPYVSGRSVPLLLFLAPFCYCLPAHYHRTGCSPDVFGWIGLHCPSIRAYLPLCTVPVWIITYHLPYPRPGVTATLPACTTGPPGLPLCVRLLLVVLPLCLPPGLDTVYPTIGLPAVRLYRTVHRFWIAAGYYTRRTCHPACGLSIATWLSSALFTTLAVYWIAHHLYLPAAASRYRITRYRAVTVRFLPGHT